MPKITFTPRFVAGFANHYFIVGENFVHNIDVAILAGVFDAVQDVLYVIMRKNDKNYFVAYDIKERAQQNFSELPSIPISTYSYVYLISILAKTLDCGEIKLSELAPELRVPKEIVNW